MKKYFLTCELENLKNFEYNHRQNYMFYKGLPKGEYLFIDCQTNEIEFSDIKLLKLLEGNYIIDVSIWNY